MPVKSYIFRVELEKDEDGRWSAVVPGLPGCAVDGETADEALEAIREAAQAYVEILVEDGRPVPLEEVASVVDGRAIAIVA
jgi:predicted RNase H-like HicB family nuclease